MKILKICIENFDTFKYIEDINHLGEEINIIKQCADIACTECARNLKVCTHEVSSIISDT